MPGAGGNVTVYIGTVYLVVGCLVGLGYDYSVLQCHITEDWNP
jgi:hypothetical protein